jgi:peptidoglycan-N-acetylglucosamine deacetylase
MGIVREPIKTGGAWLALLFALVLAGCGSASGSSVLTSSGGSTPVRSGGPALVGNGGPAPVGCTHHMVFVRGGSGAGRTIALSFDDTPSPYTEAIFKTLLRYRVRATFFVIGDRIGKHGPLLREMVADGMELGNHSYTHPRGLATEGPGASRELALANAAIERASGFRPCLFRPPYGVLTPDLVQRAKEAGLTTAKWEVNPEDWTHPGVAVIRERVLREVRPGAIIILHDNVETEGQTVQALPAILEGLQARGYHLVTITQLLGDRFIAGRG